MHKRMNGIRNFGISEEDRIPNCAVSKKNMFVMKRGRGTEQGLYFTDLNTHVYFLSE